MRSVCCSWTSQTDSVLLPRRNHCTRAHLSKARHQQITYSERLMCQCQAVHPVAILLQQSACSMLAHLAPQLMQYCSSCGFVKRETPMEWTANKQAMTDPGSVGYPKASSGRTPILQQGSAKVCQCISKWCSGSSCDLADWGGRVGLP